jgi:para-nitrobenzyl esterase
MENLMIFLKAAGFCALAGGMTVLRARQLCHVQQTTAAGVLEGVMSADGRVRVFKGIPYAAPPVGPLRWQPPQPVAPWPGVRPALDFAPRAMQGRIYNDMVFRDDGPSEDCLYLNVWAPEPRSVARLPVMVWIHGGGFAAGSSSEPRQDGASLCQKGVVVVSMNYRMGVFGFLALPELARESARHASGNYGLMDIIASLEWVRDNIAAFGGDPGNVTIFGESAGSFAVSALMAAPPARGLFHRAIGESGAIFGSTLPVKALADAELEGAAFAEAAFGTTSVAVLRAKSAQELLDATLQPPRTRFALVVDGHVLPADGRAIFGAGRQAHVPLLAGWNRDESNYRAFFGGDAPTLANYRAHAKTRFGAAAAEYLKAYPATDDAEARRAARDLSGDDFIGYSTWKWIELHRRTGDAPVYRYHFEQTLPLAPSAPADAEPIAPHACDIEYVFRVLPSRPLPWRAEDHAVSEMVASYWTNFAKTGNPNGPGLPDWPEYKRESGFPVMHLNAAAAAAPDTQRARYELLDDQAR